MDARARESILSGDCRIQVTVIVIISPNRKTLRGRPEIRPDVTKSPIAIIAVNALTLKDGCSLRHQTMRSLARGELLLSGLDHQFKGGFAGKIGVIGLTTEQA